jgi:Ni2+-binding GTPase involved in maturation of urease and hydrogenase
MWFGPAIGGNLSFPLTPELESRFDILIISAHYGLQSA